jgi:hypothetical protein
MFWKKEWNEINPILHQRADGKVRVEQDTERYWRIYEDWDGVWELSSKHARFDKAMKVAKDL